MRRLVFNLTVLLFACVVMVGAAEGAPRALTKQYAAPAAHVAQAPSATVAHCTDFPAASQRDATTDQDDLITNYTAWVDSVFSGSSEMNAPLLLSGSPTSLIPSGNGWRVLIRPNAPFAV